MLTNFMDLKKTKSTKYAQINYLLKIFYSLK